MKIDPYYKALPIVVLNMLMGISIMFSHSVQAGPLDPDCTVEKAAKSAAAKATVGIGGRCSPAEAARDTAKRAVGIEEKGPVEKMRNDNDGIAKGAVKKMVE